MSETTHLNIPVEITHEPHFMVSLRYDSHNRCFQFSVLYLQGYLTINQNSLGFESGLLILCCCSLSLLGPCEYLRCHSLSLSAPLQEDSHWFLMFSMFGPSSALTHEQTHGCGLLPNSSKILRSARRSKPLT